MRTGFYVLADLPLLASRPSTPSPSSTPPASLPLGRPDHCSRDLCSGPQLPRLRTGSGSRSGSTLCHALGSVSTVLGRSGAGELGRSGLRFGCQERGAKEDLVLLWLWRHAKRLLTKVGPAAPPLTLGHAASAPHRTTRACTSAPLDTPPPNTTGSPRALPPRSNRTTSSTCHAPPLFLRMATSPSPTLRRPSQP